MEQKGKLVVISGFSGAGKGTLMKALLAAHPDRYALSVSATTRDPRPGEKDGVDYFFVTDEMFDSMIQKDDFLEYAKYVSHSYGTPRSYVEENLNLGKNVILEIEIQGALKVKEKIKRCRRTNLCTAFSYPIKQSKTRKERSDFAAVERSSQL